MVTSIGDTPIFPATMIMGQGKQLLYSRVLGKDSQADS